MCMIESLCLFVPKHISVGAVFPIPFETPVYFLFCPFPSTPNITQGEVNYFEEKRQIRKT